MRLRAHVPVLVRERGSVQVGLERPARFEHLDAEQAAFLASLEGRPSPITPREVRRFADVLAVLDEQGLLDRVTPMDDAPRPCVSIARLDPWGAAVAAALAREGIVALALPSAPNVVRTLLGANPSMTLAREHARPAVRVLTSFGATPIHETRALVMADVPHLVVVVDDGGATVENLVIPGVTACSVCAHLARVEDDPGWAMIASQLAWPARPVPPPVTPVVVSMVGALAARVVVRFLLDGHHEPRAWRVDRVGVAPRALDRRPHPECGCGAAEIEETEVEGTVVAPRRAGRGRLTLVQPVGG